MRDILFHGRSTDTGEWVFGNLLGDSVIVPCNQLFHVEARHIYDTLEAINVDPETVELIIKMNKERN